MESCSIQKLKAPESQDAFSRTAKLSIPNRPSDALSGSQVLDQIRDLPREEREVIIWNEVKKGNIPNFLRTLVMVSDTVEIQNQKVNIRYYVLPDYLALGSNRDYFLCPMTPRLGQKIASELGCFLPTRKMVNQIWKLAALQLEPEPIPPSAKMVTVPVFEKHDKLVWKQRRTFLNSKPLGSLVSGHKKDVIISNGISKNRNQGKVVIYGWHYTTGKPIQPLYAGHADYYADYSHGIRLIQQIVYVNEEPMLASDLLRSEKLHGLLSDEGPIIKAQY
jgi:hypothetical protein